MSLLVLLFHGSARAQDTDGSNPTGPSGSFSGEVTTAGSYDPFTGNIKRRVTDLVVPGSNGAYPLQFSRIFNSNRYYVANDNPVLGDAVNWRHSYQWALSPNKDATSGTVLTYTVAYPDGGVIVFKPHRGSTPSNEYATYWRGPGGTADRLEVADAAHIYLHTSDGGIVAFEDSNWPNYIADPNGARTLLTYVANNPAFLDTVTESGGRWLKFSYTTTSYPCQDLGGANHTITYTELTTVTASNTQHVTYTNITAGYYTANPTPKNPDHQYPAPYRALQDVNYGREDATGSSEVHARYGYNNSNSYGVVPSLIGALDPHYTGAMTSITYAGDLSTGTSFEERNSKRPIERASGFPPGSDPWNQRQRRHHHQRGDAR